MKMFCYCFRLTKALEPCRLNDIDRTRLGGGKDAYLPSKWENGIMTRLPMTVTNERYTVYVVRQFSKFATIKNLSGKDKQIFLYLIFFE